MTDRCRRSFEEALLSGFVDRELTQADEQRVRIHVEDCAVCRAQVEEVVRLKEVTMSSEFKVPADRQWSEAPRGGASRMAFGVGWLFLVPWAVAVAGFSVWAFLTSDERIVDKVLTFTLVSGPVLLLVSVLIDRLKAMKTDRYREVEK